MNGILEASNPSLASLAMQMQRFEGRSRPEWHDCVGRDRLQEGSLPRRSCANEPNAAKSAAEGPGTGSDETNCHAPLGHLTP